MTDFDDGGRPRKCRKIENDEDELLRALLREEIDLEIGLRTRLQETVESRLAWALVLQDALEKQITPEEKRKIQEGPNQFADLALAAYKAANSSSELFFPVEPPGLFANVESQALHTRANEPGKSPVQEPHRPRHATRPHVQLHHEDRVVREPNKYLYLRDSTATPTMIYKIACPDCHRSDFPRLQGLLNHCRLKHQREFASHDECVQACSIVVPEEEQAFVIEHGLEVTGMSASLQRLFKMAVGSYEGIVTVPEAEVDELAMLVRPRYPSSGKEEEEEREEAAFVTKTLGHHKDTPALAPFLGRAPKKRQIHVYDDGRPLDVVSVDEVPEIHGWSMPYQESSRGWEAVPDEAPSDDDLADASNKGSVSKGVLKAYDGSRFHIPLRLIVSDQSLRLPEGSTQSGGATHKWLLSVTAASYSLHISTVLAKMSVKPATAPVLATLTGNLSASEPPFCVMGTSDKSFLAQITLEWIGTWNKPTQIEHWVQLHDGKSARPIKGDEQVLDVELDRHTQVLPRKSDTWRVDWSTEKDEGSGPSDEQEKKLEATGKSEPVPEWEQRLRMIVQRFPMTAQDAGSRKLPRVPYFLPLTTQHFLSLIEGRRKAIEWGRARAVWEAFVASAPEKEAEIQEQQAFDSGPSISRPGDVYLWMKAKGLFLSGAPQSSTTPKPHKPLPDVFCSFCGLRPSAHRRGKGGRTKDAEEGPSGRTCERLIWAGRMTIVDVQDFLGSQSQTVRRRGTAGALSGGPPNRLLEKIDPALLLGVQRLVSALQLSCFPSSSVPFLSGALPTKESRETELMPYIVLTASLRLLIHSLVCGGLQAMDMKSESSGKPLITGFGGSHGPKKRLLVPVHIIRGLNEGARKKGHRELHRALLLAMARLGVGVQDVQPSEIHADALTLTPKMPIAGSDQKERNPSEVN